MKTIILNEQQIATIAALVEAMPGRYALPLDRVMQEAQSATNAALKAAEPNSAADTGQRSNSNATDA